MSNVQTPKTHKLSVVVASQNARLGVAECLREIENQCIEIDAQIIVVDNSTDGTDEIISNEFRKLNLIQALPGALIPQLWAAGISASCGEIIALTTTHFTPSKNWIASILAAHDNQYAGVGGAIENSKNSGIIAWAIYFCRYSQFMRPFSEKLTENFAADNASYKRSALEQVDLSTTDGFWEVFVHREMRKKNLELLLSPKILVYHHNSFTFGGFIRQRYQHGQEFGRTRAENISSARRIILLLFSPLIPGIYIYRISTQVFRKKLNRFKLLLSIPILFLFLISWTAGEFCGYLKR